MRSIDPNDRVPSGAITVVIFAAGLYGCTRETNERLAAELAPYALSAGVSGFLWLSAWAARWFAAHTKNGKLAAGILRLNDAVSVSVRAIEQTTAAALKAKTDSGKLTKTDALAVRDAALAAVKDHFGPKDLAALAKTFGVQDLTDILTRRIEAAVFDMKAAPAPVVAAPVAPAGSPGADAIAALLRAAKRTP